MSGTSASSHAMTRKGCPPGGRWRPGACPAFSGEFCFIFTDLFAESPAPLEGLPGALQSPVMGVSSFLPSPRPSAQLGSPGRRSWPCLALRHASSSESVSPREASAGTGRGEVTSKLQGGHLSFIWWCPSVPMARQTGPTAEAFCLAPALMACGPQPPSSCFFSRSRRSFESRASPFSP